MKAKKCIVLANTRMGQFSTEIPFDSIAKAVKWAKDSPYFAYRIFADEKLVRSGYCHK